MGLGGGAASCAPADLSDGESTGDESCRRWRSSAWASWAAPWPPTWSRRVSTSRALPPPGIRGRRCSPPVAGGPAAWPPRCGTPTRSSPCCRTPRTSRRSRSGRTASLASAPAGALYIDMSSIRPDVARQVAAAGAAQRAALPGRTGQRRRAGRDRRDAVHHGRRGGRRRRGRPAAAGCDGRHDPARRPGRRRADRQGREPAHRGGQHRARGRGTRVPAGPGRGCRGGRRVSWRAASPAARCSTRKAGSMLAGDFTAGFRIELHDKDLAIFTAAAREARVVTPLGGILAQLTGAAARRATAVSITRRSCGSSSGSPACCRERPPDPARSRHAST